MIPLVIDPARLAIALVGRGAVAADRLRGLRAGGPGNIAVYSDEAGQRKAGHGDPVHPVQSGADQAGAVQSEADQTGNEGAGSELALLAGAGFRARLPRAEEWAGFHLVWIAGLPAELAHELAARARAAGALVNVEDDPAWCDFHNVAQVRRGDLLLTVSTGGKSPGLAARIRRVLERQFGPEWSERTAALGARRAVWKREEQAPETMARLTDAAIDTEGWL